MRGYIRGVAPPRDEVLLFRQKDPKPWVPGRGPSGAFPPVPPTEYLEISSPNQLVYRLLKGDQKVLVNVVHPPMGDIIPVVLQFP